MIHLLSKELEILIPLIKLSSPASKLIFISQFYFYLD